MNLAQQIEKLKAYAQENYEAGGHWLAETQSDAGWEQFLWDNDNDLRKAKADAKGYWELLNEKQSNCY